jgi:hypothetical protein
VDLGILGSRLWKAILSLLLLSNAGLALCVYRPSTRSMAAGGETTSSVAKTAAESAATLLQQKNLQYVGAFRVPAGFFGSPHGFSFGGAPLTYDPARNSLFVGGHPNDYRIAEISIPTPVNSAKLSDLPIADVRQPFGDPTEGNAYSLLMPGNAVMLGGLLVAQGKMYGTAYIYYDANGDQRVSHYSRSPKLNDASATALQSVGDPVMTGFVSGYLAAVPDEWQAALGGPAITGQCCIPIVSRTSWGPDAFSWNPADLGSKKPVPVNALLYYTGDQPTLGPWGGSNPLYGGTTQVGGLALIAGTRSALFFGTNGVGPFCYGPGTDDRQLEGKPVPGATDVYCYDPTNFEKSPHAYPYNYQVWAYDLNDWAAVRAGRRQPFDIKPYATWAIDLPTAGGLAVGGVGYDPQRQLVYISQPGADPGSEEFRPLIHVFHVSSAPATTGLPQPPDRRH